MSAAAKAEARVPTDEPVIEITRVFDAPRDLVWECFTDPKHLAHWWGPNGFSITNHAMDVRTGGRWDFVMHGPDGRDWDSIITYTEVKKPERLVYQHGQPGEPPLFVSTVTFSRETARTTRISLLLRFPTVDARDKQVREVRAAEGGKQTLDRLAGYIATPSAMGAMSGIVRPGMVTEFERIFDAPRELVFACWTQAHHLKAWWGPAGSDNGETHIDARPGGDISIHMRGPGFDHPMGGTVEEIDPPHCLVFLSKAFPDADGHWTLVNRNTVIFEAVGSRTRIRLHTLVERMSEAFAVPVDDMKAGWAGSLDRLAALLAKIGAGT